LGIGKLGIGRSGIGIWISVVGLGARLKLIQVQGKIMSITSTLVSANIAQEQGQREHFLPFAPGGLWVNGQ
jgi:hypothetical protein